jgi:hypothetical protein
MTLSRRFVSATLALTISTILWTGRGGLAFAGTINIGDGAAGVNPLGTLAPQDPVLVGDGTNLSVSIQGSAEVTDHILLALLIPNNTTDFFGGVNPLGAITIYPDFPGAPAATPGSSAFVGAGGFIGLGASGMTGTDQGSGFWGVYDTTTTSELNDFLDPYFSNSNNTTNFTAFDASLGVAALSNVTNYGVYTLMLTTGAMTSDNGNKALVDIAIANGLPLGTIAVALSDRPDSTVWTNAGGVNKTLIVSITDDPIATPEPASLFLIGSALTTLGARRWRKQRS